MLNILSDGLNQGQLTLPGILICTVVSLVLGFGIAGLYMYRNNYTKSFVITLALLPALVQIVIMIVNGNIGTGVAVAGAFGLVRFRSAPGNARDISCVFFAMAIGLATGMGYLVYAAVFLVVIGLANILLLSSPFGDTNRRSRMLKITIPENLDYDGLFDDLFQKFTDQAYLEQVKTTNLGSLYELQYSIRLKTASLPKEFIDELRCRNGNLNITLGKQDTASNGL